MATRKGISINARVSESGKVCELKGKELAKFWAYVGDAFAGKPIEISVKSRSASRSVQQNRYLWGVVYPHLVWGFYDHGMIHTTEDIHSTMKDLFLKDREVILPQTGEIITVPCSTASLNKDDFGEYVEKIKAWAIENLGVSIPDPNELFEELPI